MWPVIVAVLVMAVMHVLLGLVSVIIGVTSSIQAEVWLAHSVSPIWSGGFFIITGILGFACARKKTAYMILCFTAFSIVSLVTAIVSIQLLRLGLVSHTADGHTFQKENKDVLIITALVVGGFECLICVFSSFISCRLARAAKKELFKKREGTFHVQDENDYYNGNVISIPTVSSACTGFDNEGGSFRADTDFQTNSIEICIHDEQGVAISPQIDMEINRNSSITEAEIT